MPHGHIVQPGHQRDTQLSFGPQPIHQFGLGYPSKRRRRDGCNRFFIAGLFRPDGQMSTVAPQKPNSLNALYPYLLLSLASLFWAGNIVIARGITSQISPVTLAFVRWSLATLIVWPFAWRHIRRDWPVIRTHWGILTLLGFLGITCFNTLLYTAVETTTAINGAIVQTAMPVIIVLISLLFFGETIRWQQLVGLIVAAAGAVIVVTGGSWQTLISLNFVRGDLLILLAVTLYGLYSILLRRRPALHSLSLVAITFLLGWLILIPFFLWELSIGIRFEFGPRIAFAFLYVAIFPSILAYLCWNGGIAQVGANRGGFFVYLLPVFATILSVIFLNEAPRLFHLIGFLLILAGITLFSRLARPV